MLTGDAYSSGHLVNLGLAYVLLVEINPFSELVFFPDYSLRTSLCTFLTLLCQMGVRQGENVRPFLFAIYINDLRHSSLKIILNVCRKSGNMQ